jgi:hypothetical protein
MLVMLSMKQSKCVTIRRHCRPDVKVGELREKGRQTAQTPIATFCDGPVTVTGRSMTGPILVYRYFSFINRAITPRYLLSGRVARVQNNFVEPFSLRIAIVVESMYLKED